MEGAKLIVQAAGQQPFEVQPEAPDPFFASQLPAQFTFENLGSEAGVLKLHQNGRVGTGQRISSEAAQAAAVSYDRKLAAQERPRTRIVVSQEVLARYPGTYALTVTTSMTVTIEDDCLFGQVTGQRRFELFPETDTEFFITIVAAQVSFVADEAGRVTHAVLHQHGRDILMVRTGTGEEA